jgi:uncharacterized membrane protein
MVAATLSLLGFLLSLYLWLWKIGVIGALACGTGTCEQVQTSQYATLMGMPVALIGALGYLGLLCVSLLGLQPRWIERREPTLWLAVLSGLGVAFTAYLSFIEGFVIHAWCRWCLGSAALIVAIFLTSITGLKGGKREKGKEKSTTLESEVR